MGQVKGLRDLHLLKVYLAEAGIEACHHVKSIASNDRCVPLGAL